MDIDHALRTSTVRLIIESFIGVIATYVFTIQWKFYYGKFGYNNGQRHSQELREAILLLISSFCAFLTVILQILGDDIIINHLFSLPHFAAVIIVNVNYLLYFVSLMLTYSVLWLRQRNVLLDPALLHLSNSVSSFISRYFIILIVFLGVVLLPTTIAFYVFGICIEQCYVNTLLLSLTIAPLTVQLPLLSLILFPLFKYHMTNVSTNQKYLTLIKRMSTLAAICLMSDVMTGILHVYFDALFTPLQINLIVNVICVIMTPLNWKERLFPCFTSDYATAISP